MKEEWKPVLGYEGQYNISNHGKVESLKWGKSRILKQKVTNEGYLMVCIGGKSLTVHRLALLTFKGVPDKNYVCCHLNGIRSDNRIENLKWGTLKDNQRHRFDHGTVNNKLTEQSVHAIRRLSSQGLNHREISEKFNVHQTTITSVLNRKSWKHV